MTYRTFGFVSLAAAPSGRSGLTAPGHDDSPWAVPPGARRIGWLRDVQSHQMASAANLRRVDRAGADKPATNHDH